jgi:general secretion pathway protein H
MAARVVKGKMPTLSAGNKWNSLVGIWELNIPGFKTLQSKSSPLPRSALPIERSDPALKGPNLKFVGFTLLELLLVLLLLGVMIVLALPSIGSGVKTLQLHNSARIVAATLRYARTKAIREQKIYRLRFKLDSSQIELRDEEKKFQRVYDLPGEVTIQRIGLLRSDQTEEKKVRFFAFLPNGMSESFEVLLTNSKGRKIKVIQDNWTNSPRIEKLEE